MNALKQIAVRPDATEFFRNGGDTPPDCTSDAIDITTPCRPIVIGIVRRGAIRTGFLYTSANPEKHPCKQFRTATSPV
ncbi:hypothetical protein [Umezawaea sp. Da 62-37]|uniref:hypothetical protein n=1 Tax=Umezawaea sp. Da 62-37 TaxID=3075927 RepID=UPI0028F745C3|nr:hypothetical protein [Umezawaea sp. Da 62-37]WNV86913.1 hypothetical protein RM788_01080 [Umezawaea sp. Da 62-37]